MSVDRCERSEDVGRRAVVRCLLPDLPYGDYPHIGVCKTHCKYCKMGDPDDVRPRKRTPIDPAITAEARRRFEICKTCEHAVEDAHKCELHKGCCFGSWRANRKSVCHADPPKWG